jgi:hypothetical protein
MPDFLSVVDWKKELKSHPDAREAADLTRPLEDYAKSKGSPERQIASLKSVMAKAQALKSKFSKDRGLASYLADVVKAAAEAREEAEEAADDQDEDQEDQDEADDVSFDPELVKQLLVVRNIGEDRARYFVLALGKPSGLTISKVPITKKHKDQAKKWRVGKGKLLFGRCYGESGKYIFELEDKPPGGLARNIKKAVKIQAEKEIKLKVRGGGLDIEDDADLDEMDDQGEEVSESSSTEAPNAEARNAEVPSAEASSDTTAPAPTPPSDRAALETAITQRLTTLMPQLRGVIAANGPHAEELKGKIAEANAKVRARNYPEANALLDQVETLMNAPVTTSEPQAPHADDADAGTDFTNRLKALLVAAKQAQGSPLFSEIKLKASEAQYFARKRDFTAGARVLDELQSLIDSACRPTTPDATSPPSKGSRPTSTLGLWRDAREEVLNQVSRLQSALRAERDPDFDVIADKGLNGITKRLQVGLHVALLEFDQAAGEAKERARTKAQTIVGNFQKFLSDEPLVQLIEENPFNVTVTVRSSLGAALDQLSAALSP